MSHCSLGAHRIAPCFFTSAVCLLLPQAAAYGFAPARLGFKSFLNFYTKIKDGYLTVPVFILAGAEGLEPSARGFGDRCSTN